MTAGGFKRCPQETTVISLTHAVVAMRDEILTYWEMCSREGLALQKGMYFRKAPGVSIVLMSQRPGAPYEDSLSEDGRALSYEGHDIKKTAGIDPKSVDQPWTHPDGGPTDNAKFANSAGRENAPLVRVYEKLRPGIWSDKGLFRLSGYEYLSVGHRKVFKFTMSLADLPDEPGAVPGDEEFRRAIPSWVKQVVYKRDGGKCVICGGTGRTTAFHFAAGASSKSESCRTCGGTGWVDNPLYGR